MKKGQFYKCQIVILKKDALLNKIDHKHISRDADVVNNGCF